MNFSPSAARYGCCPRERGGGVGSVHLIARVPAFLRGLDRCLSRCDGAGMSGAGRGFKEQAGVVVGLVHAAASCSAGFSKWARLRASRRKRRPSRSSFLPVLNAAQVSAAMRSASPISTSTWEWCSCRELASLSRLARSARWWWSLRRSSRDSLSCRMVSLCSRSLANWP